WHSDKALNYLSPKTFASYAPPKFFALHAPRRISTDRLSSLTEGSMNKFIKRIFQFRSNMSKTLSKCLNPGYNETVTQLHQSLRQKRPNLCIVDYISIAYFDACISLNITTVIMRPSFLLKTMHYVPPLMSGASIHSTFFQRLSWDLNQHMFHFLLGGDTPFK
ncbi:hypothetical protein BC937DRAFT_86368, partial [Endogone sp. FLAS-F59071]